MCGYHYFISNLPFKMDFGTLRTFLRKKQILPNKIIPSGRNARLYFKTEEEGEEFMNRIEGGFEIKRNTISARKVKDKQQTIPTRQLVDRCDKSEINYHEEFIKAVAPLYYLDYDRQLELKAGQVEEFFNVDIRKDKFLDEAAAEKLDKIKFLPIKSSPIIEGYRNKCEFTVGQGVNGGIEVGFRLSRHSDGVEIMAPDNCPIVSPAMKGIVSQFSQYLSKHADSPLKTFNLAVFNPVDNSGHWKLLIMREVNQADPQIMITFVVYRQQLTYDELVRVKENLVHFVRSIEYSVKSVHFAVLESNKCQYSPDVPCELLMGEEYVIERLAGLEFGISPASFFQVNTMASEILFKSVAELVRENRKEGEFALLDLCCGTGTFAIILSGLLNPCKTVGIELCSAAVADARANVKRNNVENVEFIAEDVRTALPRVLKEVTADAVVVLDPPRSGVHRNVISSIRGEDHVRTILFVSCALSKARANIVDLLRVKSKKMPGDPFQVQYVLPIDMFPHTHQSEVIVYMTR